jgi:hypothetical protein
VPAPPELPESIILQQFAGMKNTVSPERLTGAELERAINVDLDDAGQLRRRRGYDLKLAGSFHSIKSIGGKVYGAKDGVLGIIRPDYTFFSLSVTVGAAPVCYTSVADDVYFSTALTAGIIADDETVSAWGATGGQGEWLSPVINPTDTLGAISGKLLGDPPRATAIEAYKGRIYLAQGSTLWATELFKYHYVDRTKGFMQFEHDIVLLMAMTDGLYVGTTQGIYFIQGVLGEFKLSMVAASPVLPGSGVWVPADLVHPQAANQPIPTGEAAVFMTEAGICAGFDSGTCYNLTQARVVFPQAISAAALFRQDSGANTYVAVADSAGGPNANARIGDYVDAEIIRFGGA